MNTSTHERKGSGKTFLSAVAVIAACTLLSGALSEVAVASEMRRSEEIPTSYSIAPVSTTKNIPPDGYIKAEYTIKQDDLESVRNNKPTSKDLTQEYAAEVGAQMLWKLYGVDLTGADIYMSYLPATEDYPRASWFGDVRFGPRVKPDGTPGVNYYGFWLDSITGEMFSTGCERTLDIDVPLGPDAALAKNPTQYTEIATALAEKFDVVHGEVKSASYAGQGYIINDPIVSINIVGVNGELATMGFSRYDQKFKNVSFDENVRLNNAANEKHMRELENAVKDKQSVGDCTPNLTGIN